MDQIIIFILYLRSKQGTILHPDSTNYQKLSFNTSEMLLNTLFSETKRRIPTLVSLRHTVGLASHK